MTRGSGLVILSTKLMKKFNYTKNTNKKERFSQNAQSLINYDSINLDKPKNYHNLILTITL